MSDIKSQVQEDLKAAMKAGDKEKVTNLRGLMSEIKQVEIDTRADVPQEQQIAIVQKEVKKRRDALKYAEEQNREDLVSQNNAEIALLQNYLGEQLSEEKLRELISKMIEGGADSIGKVMGGLNKEYKGQFEGKVASEIAKSILG